MSAEADLESMIARIRSLGDLPSHAAKEAAPLVEKAVQATANAGTDPTGQPWETRKKDGRRALVNAAKAVSGRAKGALVQVVLTGVEVFHHYSHAHPRRIIPEQGVALPAGVVEALKTGASSAYRKAMGGK